MKNLDVTVLTSKQFEDYTDRGRFTTYYNMLDVYVVTHTYGTKHVRCRYIYNTACLDIIKKKYTNLF